MRAKAGVKQWLHERWLSPLDWHTDSEDTLVFLVGKQHVAMLAVALHSLKRHERTLPRLCIAADSAEAASAIARVVGHNPAVHVMMWDERRDDVSAAWQGFLTRYVATPRWAGFGKKLTLLLSLNARKDVLYSDSDMLWYAPVLEEIRGRMHTHPSGMCVGSDCFTSYDLALLEHLRFTFRTAVPLNTGFLSLAAGALPEALSHTRLTGWEEYPGPFGCHTEQTLIACAADCVGGHVLPADFVGVTMADSGRFSRHVTPRVRHYVGPKTLFWRDC